jgi:transcriptional regulator with XRE-family HTH domain
MEVSFGNFLKEKRKEKNLTQKELAKLLFVTESAVSKWEKDNAHPDITLLPKLSEILGVSEHELITASVDRGARLEKVQAKKWRAVSLSWNLFFYISYAVAILTCFICNLAVNKTLSWFWIVLSALILSFTFTNLPQFIKKLRLILIPLSMYLALCLLLGVCAIYTNGSWFFIASLSVLLGLVIIFGPIYISKYDCFAKIRKYNDFVSVATCFVILNIMLIAIDLFSVSNGAENHWYLPYALPIALVGYLVVNALMCVRFLKVNKLVKTSIILILVNIFVYIVPLFIKLKDPYLQYELDSFNIFKADFFNWNIEILIERNIHCIIFLTILILSVTFFVGGLVLNLKNKKKIKN